MSALHPAWAVILTAVAALFSFLLFRRQVVGPKQGRFDAIDGLRGYLAFFVFLHHSAIWYFFLRTGFWQAPASAFLYAAGRGKCFHVFHDHKLFVLYKIARKRG